MKTRIYLMFLLLFFSLNLQAKYLHEYFVDIEKLLINKKYDEATLEFEKLDSNVKGHLVKSIQIRFIYKNTVKWLKSDDDLNIFLTDVGKNINLYSIERNTNISKNECLTGMCVARIGMINTYPKFVPFSNEFVGFLNDKAQSSLKNYKQKITNIKMNQKKRRELKRVLKIEKNNEIKKQKRIAHQKKINLIKKQKKQVESENKIQQQKNKLALESEINKVDFLVKKKGYKGFLKISLIRMIYETRQKGNLEFYLNKVIGCHSLVKRHCRSYSKIKALQKVKNGVLYNYSELKLGELLDFTIFVKDKDVFLYQDSQSLKNSYYSLFGTFEYETILGTTKIVPAFEEVILD